MRQLYVFRGAGVGLPPSVNADHYADVEIGGHRVKASSIGADGTVYARLGPELLVTGNRSLVEPPLLGKPWSGALTPDQMSLLSGRAQALAHGCWQISESMLTEGNLPFRKAEWPEGQKPTHLMLRLKALGAEDDLRLEFEAIVRHPQPGAAVTQTQEVLQQWLQGMKSDPKLGRLPVWDAFRLQPEAQDLAIRLDLGKVRSAAGTLAQLLVPLLVPKSMAAEVPRPAEPGRAK